MAHIQVQASPEQVRREVYNLYLFRSQEPLDDFTSFLLVAACQTVAYFQ